MWWWRALGERIAEGVIGVRMLGPDLDQLAERSFENVHPLDFLGEHGVVVEQLGIVRKAIERLPDEVERGLGLVGLAQELRFGEDQLDPLLAALRGRLLQVGARRVDLALPGEYLRVAHLRWHILLALAHLAVPAQRFRKILALFGDLAEIQPHPVFVAVLAVEQAPQIPFGRVIVLELQRKQRHRERHVGAVGCAGHELLELGASLGEALLRHQHPRVREARFAGRDRKSTRLNSSHMSISYAVFCLKNKKQCGFARPKRLLDRRQIFVAVMHQLFGCLRGRQVSFQHIAAIEFGGFLLRFFFNDTPTTEIYTLSLHDALPISASMGLPWPASPSFAIRCPRAASGSPRSEEHTSELQSHVNIVCRLLLEKKKKNHINHLRYEKKKRKL